MCFPACSGAPAIVRANLPAAVAALKNKHGKPEPVAICRLKRVAADNKGEIDHLLPPLATKKNGKRIVCIGAGPASLTVARDLLPLGYEVHIYDAEQKGGGMIRTQIPRFRLPESVIDEEVDYILRYEPVTHFRHSAWIR